jgi:poly-gamma-glutamate synthesis protein (capsule biosynthesis protein)
MLGRGVAAALKGRWELALTGVAFLLWSSEAIANLESPLTSEELVTGGHDLRAYPEAVAALRSGGIDIVTLANNHALDAGVEGLVETRSALAEAGVEAVVEGESRLIGSRQGPQAFAVIALDDSRSALDLGRAAELVRASAKQGLPVVVSIHWGGEYQAEPSQRQRLVAEVLSSAGADIIAGHGPHVLQPIEYVGDALVAYSLGNLLFDQPYPIECRWGAIVRLLVADCRAVGIVVYPTVTYEGRSRVADGSEVEPIRMRLGLPPEAVLAPPPQPPPWLRCDVRSR